MEYFDYAASTPLHPEAANAYVKLSQSCYGNTSSLHEVGAEAQNILAYSRQEIANTLGVEAAGIYFTGSGTESNLVSIISLAKANKYKGNHIITTLGEHPSVDAALAYLKEDGFSISEIPFNDQGFVNLELLKDAITSQTILISVQHVNPEIGTIQPIAEIALLAEEHSLLLHSDCIQSFGKIDIQPIAKVVDSLTISAHKVYGPKGVGVTYIHPKHRLVPIFPGLVHESGLRGGTVNVPGIAALTTAVKQLPHYKETWKQFSVFRQKLLSQLAAYPTYFTFHEANDQNQQLPHIIGLRANNIEGQLMMLELNRKGFAISTGSACQVGQQTTSKAMHALQIEPAIGREFIRISFGATTTLENVQGLANQLINTVKEIQVTRTPSKQQATHV